MVEDPGTGEKPLEPFIQQALLVGCPLLIPLCVTLMIRAYESGKAVRFGIPWWIISEVSLPYFLFAASGVYFVVFLILNQQRAQRGLPPTRR